MNYRAPFSVFLAALTLLLISSHDSVASQLRDYPRRLPEKIEHALGVLNMDSTAQGQKVSVTFWSSEDAASRLANIRQANLARNNPLLTHVGVNVSDPPELFDAYLLRDNLLHDSLQLRAEGDAARTLLNTYGYTTLYR